MNLFRNIWDKYMVLIIPGMSYLYIGKAIGNYLLLNIQ